MTIQKIIESHNEWATRNFPTAEKWEPLVGVQEELGELSHAFLKAHQGIRTNENHAESMADAVGDIQMYLWHFCALNGIDWEQSVRDVWETISRRDWTKHKQNGVDNA